MILLSCSLNWRLQTSDSTSRLDHINLPWIDAVLQEYAFDPRKRQEATTPVYRFGAAQEMTSTRHRLDRVGN